VKLFKSPLRRSTAVLAGAFLGMAGAVALAAPASAHHTDLSITSTCIGANDNWVITWSLKSSESDITANLDKVTALPLERGKITGIVKGATLPKSGDGPLVGVQTLKPSVRNAYLSVESHWTRPQSDGSTRDIKFVSKGDAKRPTQKCELTPTPSQSTPTQTPTPTPSESSPTSSPSVSTTPSETPTPSASPSATPTVPVGNNGNLPKTGAAAGGIAAGAAALLAIGGFLFIMARRRKVKFTA
jgi:LPXTG-motif cell wall-anchored protein